MHKEAYEWVEHKLESLSFIYPHAQTILEIGSYNFNGSIKPLFIKKFEFCTYAGIDIRPGPGVDYVKDAGDKNLRWNFIPNIIVCCEVLEHAEHAKQIIHNIQLLKPTLTFITCASEKRKPHGVNGAEPPDTNEWYQGIKKEELQEWMRDFNITFIEENKQAGDLYALGIIT